jgi:ABC-type branched-subunit amino acid transport system substrate-binding protein
LSRTITTGLLAALLAASTSILPASAQDAAEPATIRVAGLADVELFRGAEVGARARFDAVNADGGIDGVPIELVGVVDDQRDAAVARREVQRLVAEERIEALVPVVTSRFTDDGTLADAETPAFGWGIASGFCGNRWAFAITGCLAPLLPRQVPTIWGSLVAEVLEARGVHEPSVALVTEAAAIPRTIRELRAVAQASGLRVVEARAELGTGEGATAGVTELAAELLAGPRPPDAVFTVASFAAVGAFQDALRAQGYAGVMTNLVQYGPALAAPATGAYVLTQFATSESAPDNPAMQRILAELAALTPDVVSPAMLAGWLAADGYVRARRAAGVDASPAEVARTASTMRFRVARTVGPTRYPAAFVRPTSCGQLVTSDGTTYTVAARFRCAAYTRV